MTPFDIICQIVITIFGLPAIWMVNGKTLKHQKIGAVFGLISQPFWFAEMVIHQQWIMAPVYIWYTVSWIRGVCK